MIQPICTLTQGSTPLLISIPHTGRHLPEVFKARMHPRAAQTEDTDWHLDQLFAFGQEMGASLLVPRHSRYVVDLNRPPDNTPMYPGVNNTELCPTRFFTGEPLYLPSQAPDTAEIAHRVDQYWRPYHQALRRELDRLKSVHGYALLFEAHSIRSQLPWLFEGRLPDLNLGTASGQACAPALRDRLAAVLAGQSRFTQVVDGRFKGGYITRHYGQPHEGVHAVQLEQCWCTYMDEATPEVWAPEIAAQVQPLLRNLLQTMLDWKPGA